MWQRDRSHAHHTAIEDNGTVVEIEGEGALSKTSEYRGSGAVRDKDVALLKAHIPHIRTIQITGIGHAICWGPPGKTTLEHVTQFLNSL